MGTSAYAKHKGQEEAHFCLILLQPNGRHCYPGSHANKTPRCDRDAEQYYQIADLRNHAAASPTVQYDPQILVDENEELIKINSSIFVGIQINCLEPRLLTCLEEEKGNAYAKHCWREP